MLNNLCVHAVVDRAAIADIDAHFRREWSLRSLSGFLMLIALYSVSYLTALAKTKLNEDYTEFETSLVD